MITTYSSEYGKSFDTNYLVKYTYMNVNRLPAHAHVALLTLMDHLVRHEI